MSNPKPSAWQRLLDRLQQTQSPKESPKKTPPTSPSSAKLSDITAALTIWSEQQKPIVSGNRQSARLLKQQIEEYERSIERRRQRLLAQTKLKVFAVTGSGEEVSTTSLDDKLPYEPKSLTLSSERKEKRSKGDESSSSTSSEDVSSGEQTGRLADLLQSIVEDTGTSGSKRSVRSCSPDELLSLSRTDKTEFEEVMKENTKQALFLSQPTSEESSRWFKKKARSKSSIRCPYQLMFTSVVPDEVLTFCNTCKPRKYVRYMRKKN